MSRRRLVVEVVDDGTTVDLKVMRYEGIGSSEIGPILVTQVQRLSFPDPVVEDWQRDMAVAVAELL